MGDTEGQGAEAAESSGKGGKPKLKFILIGLAVFALVAGGVGAGFFLGGGGEGRLGLSKSEEEEGVDDALDSAKKGGHGKDGKESSHIGDGLAGRIDEANLVLELPVISTDLRDPTLKYKVQAKIWVEAVDEESRALLKRKQHRLVDAAISLLRTKTREEIRSIEGEHLLKVQLKDTFDQVVGPGHVSEVGFSHRQTMFNR